MLTYYFRSLILSCIKTLNLFCTIKTHIFIHIDESASLQDVSFKIRVKKSFQMLFIIYLNVLKLNCNICKMTKLTNFHK